MKKIENGNKENKEINSNNNTCLSDNPTPIHTRCLSAIPAEMEELIAELDKSESNR